MSRKSGLEIFAAQVLNLGHLLDSLHRELLRHALGHSLRTHLLAFGSLLVRGLDVVHLEDIYAAQTFDRSRENAFLGRRRDSADQTTRNSPSLPPPDL